MTPAQAHELKRRMRMLIMRRVVAYRVRKGETVSLAISRTRADQLVKKAQNDVDNYLEQFIERKETA